MQKPSYTGYYMKRSICPDTSRYLISTLVAATRWPEYLPGLPQDGQSHYCRLLPLREEWNAVLLGDKKLTQFMQVIMKQIELMT